MEVFCTVIAYIAFSTIYKSGIEKIESGILGMNEDSVMWATCIGFYGRLAIGGMIVYRVIS